VRIALLIGTVLTLLALCNALLAGSVHCLLGSSFALLFLLALRVALLARATLLFWLALRMYLLAGTM
jgi:hypothetical protein